MSVEPLPGIEVRCNRCGYIKPVDAFPKKHGKRCGCVCSACCRDRNCDRSHALTTIRRAAHVAHDLESIRARFDRG